MKDVCLIWICLHTNISRFLHKVSLGVQINYMISLLTTTLHIGVQYVFGYQGITPIKLIWEGISNVKHTTE